jgi:hypothetical protein
MRTKRITSLCLALVTAIAGWQQAAFGVVTPPFISNLSKPAAGPLEMLFHGTGGPFLIQTRASLDAPWVDVPNSIITEVQPGVLEALIPTPQKPIDLSFYRVVSEGDPTLQITAWTVLLRVSSPANGTYFVQGESPVVTVTILDTMGQALGKNDFGFLNLYMYGPQDPLQTVTAAKLLNTTTSRTNNPHHYIDLKKNANVQVTDNSLTYALQPISTEAPGTYTVSLWASLASDGLQQMMKFANIQIGTNLVEQPVVTKTACASCHEGPVSGKIYMHHIDPGFSPTGNWALDFEPVTSCKSCHNNDGYSAYTDPTGAKISDAIVRRVHGLHMGAELQLPYNLTNDFANYAKLEFPTDVRDCTKCHVDDRWKTQPSRLACGACHDSTWFGARNQVPAGMTEHSGGPQADDKGCALCHTADPLGLEPIPASHDVTENTTGLYATLDTIDISMSPPANGLFYTAGDKPVLTLVIKDDNGTPIDHTTVTDGNFSTASLFVYGPRANAVPVLTSTAANGNSQYRASVTSSKAGPWAINGKTFTIAINGSAPQNITITGASNTVTAAEVVASLNPAITNLNGGAKATVSGSNVNIKTLTRGTNAVIAIYSGDVTTAMGWKRGPNTVMDPDITIGASFIPSNDLRALSDPLDYADPRVNRSAANITYPLDDVAALAPGTYNIYAYQIAKAGKFPTLTNRAGIGHLNFQVGSTNIEKKIATNCSDCHGDTIYHADPAAPIHPEPFDTDYCTACHDYLHTASGDMFKNQGGTSLNGWSGFGAVPIARRVHGVHFAHYLNHSEEIYANATKDTFGGIIFPQDVRNCTKCHDATTTSGTWTMNPSRVACLACHDSDQAKAHGKLMTFMTDPNDPYGPGAQESCAVCHDADGEFAPSKVHSISNPYVAPYPREPAK